MSAKEMISPISASDVARGFSSFEDLCAGDDHLFWTVSRPEEKGRYALSSLEDVGSMPALSSHSVKSCVHEYGGGAIACRGEFLYFICNTTKGLMQWNIKTKCLRLLFSSPTLRLAEIVIAPHHPFLYLIGEDHSTPAEVVNALYLFDITKTELAVVHSGRDFYMSVAISHFGDKLAFITWDHPHMSWDQSELWICGIQEDGHLADQRKVVAGMGESVLMPLWLSSNDLCYVSDRSGFWNVYRYDGKTSMPLCPMEKDFSFPHWKLGRKSIVEVGRGKEKGLMCICTMQGVDELLLIKDNEVEYIPLPFTNMTHLVAKNSCQVCFFAASPLMARSLVQYDLNARTFSVIDVQTTISIDESWLSTPEKIEFPSVVKGLSSFAFYYPPKIEGKIPQQAKALLVRSHGGPTGHNASIHSLEIQYWTSRGFGFLDVNYSGSSGFGKKYRERLRGMWGVYDAMDCIHAARYLLEKGWVTKGHFFIRGSSSGGFTALRCLMLDSLFSAATSYYGIADLHGLAMHTHKFEKHYLDSLVGPYPEKKALYTERSPLFHADDIQGGVLLFQGRKDKVVLPSQAEDIYFHLKKKNKMAQMHFFENEGHGFRHAETIERTLSLELSFYLSFIN